MKILDMMKTCNLSVDTAGCSICKLATNLWRKKCAATSLRDSTVCTYWSVSKHPCRLGKAFLLYISMAYTETYTHTPTPPLLWLIETECPASYGLSFLNTHRTNDNLLIHRWKQKCLSTLQFQNALLSSRIHLWIHWSVLKNLKQNDFFSMLRHYSG